MGMCMCTLMTPVFVGVGGGSSGVTWCLGDCGCCVEKKGYFTKKDKIRHSLAYFLVFLIGCFGLYLPLTFICANADGESWALFKGDGECWSTGGSAPGFVLGFFAAAVIGVGFGGWVVTLCRCIKEKIAVVDDDDDVDVDVENQHDEPPSEELDPDADPIETEETDAANGDVEKQDESSKASSNPVPVPVPIETREQA